MTYQLFTQRLAAKWTGGLLLLAGLLAMLGTPTIGPTGTLATGQLTILLYILAGLAGLAAGWMGHDRHSRLFHLGVGGLFAALAALGGLGLLADTLAVNAATTVFHGVLGVGLLALGFLVEPEAPYPTA